MPSIGSWIPKADFQELEKQCQLLNETPYEYVQKAVKERLRQKTSTAEKINRLLWENR
jgi:hypothetical protein